MKNLKYILLLSLVAFVSSCRPVASNLHDKILVDPQTGAEYKVQWLHGEGPKFIFLRKYTQVEFNDDNWSTNYIWIKVDAVNIF